MGDDVVPTERVTKLGKVYSSVSSSKPAQLDGTPSRETRSPITRKFHTQPSDNGHPNPAYAKTKKISTLENEMLEAEARAETLRNKIEPLLKAREAFRFLENTVESNMSANRTRPGSYPEEGVARELNVIRDAYHELGNPNLGLLTDNKVMSPQIHEQVKQSLDLAAKTQAIKTFQAASANQEKDPIKWYHAKEIDGCLEYLGVEKEKRYEFLVNEYKKLPVEQRVTDDKILSKDQYENALKEAETHKTASLTVQGDAARTAAAEVGASAGWLKAGLQATLPEGLKTALAKAGDKIGLS